MAFENKDTSPSGDEVADVFYMQGKPESDHKEDAVTARAALEEHSTLGHWESPEWRKVEKGIVRKLDMTLLPMCWILYMFNYLDRNNIA
jgi:hypothetical protein